MKKRLMTYIRAQFMNLLKFFIAVIFICIPAHTIADAAPYSDDAHLEIMSANYRVQHFHRGGEGISIVSVEKKGDEVKIFDSPNLTYLFITNDENYLIGLSNIKYKNDNQIFVFDLKNNVEIAREKVSCTMGIFKNHYCGESTTNYTIWFNTVNPEIEYTLVDNTINLHINPAIDGRCRFIEDLKKAIKNERQMQKIDQIRCDDNEKIVFKINRK